MTVTTHSTEAQALVRIYTETLSHKLTHLHRNMHTHTEALIHTQSSYTLIHTIQYSGALQ